MYVTRFEACHRQPCRNTCHVCFNWMNRSECLTVKLLAPPRSASIATTWASPFIISQCFHDNHIAAPFLFYCGLAESDSTVLLFNKLFKSAIALCVSLITSSLLNLTEWLIPFFKVRYTLLSFRLHPERHTRLIPLPLLACSLSVPIASMSFLYDLNIKAESFSSYQEYL